MVRCGTGVWGTALQIGMSWVRFQVESLRFFIDIILSDAPWSWARASLQQKRVLGLSPGPKRRPFRRADILVTLMRRLSRKPENLSLQGAYRFCPKSCRDWCTFSYIDSCCASFCLTVHTLSIDFLEVPWNYGPGSVVGIATGYRLDGPGIESLWGRDFPNLSRLAHGPN